MRIAAFRPDVVSRFWIHGAAALLPLWLLAAGAHAAPCPAPATVDVVIDDLSNGTALDLTVEGALVDPTVTCDGPGTTTYATTLHCAAGAPSCGQLSGLRPGAWINRLRVQAPASTNAQVQAARAVFLADDATNTLRWTVYPRTLVVTQPTAAELLARVADAATGPAPTLITFAPDAFPPGQGDAHPIVLTSTKCTDTDVAGLCLTASNVVVDGLGADGAPGAVVLTTSTHTRLVRVYGAGDVLRGLVLRGDRTAGVGSQADTVAAEGGARGLRIEHALVYGPSNGDGVAVGGAGGAAEVTIIDTEIRDAEDKGVKVGYGSHATVERSCVHDNHNGGIQATLGGHAVTSENLVQHNVPNSSQNGLIVTGNVLERTTLASHGDVVRYSGTRGLSVADDATGAFVDTYVAGSGIAGARVETTVPGTTATATFRGTTLACNKIAGISGFCPADARGIRRPCITDSDCCDGQQSCVFQCMPATPDGFGLAVAMCPVGGCKPPGVDLGVDRDPGLNAFALNRATATGANLSDQLASPPLSAVGNQWEHCGGNASCDSNTVRVLDVKLATGATVDLAPGDAARAGTPAPFRVSPERPRKGDTVRVYGRHFNAIDGAACPGGTAPAAACSAADDAVARQNRSDPNGNRVTLAFPGTDALAVDLAAVTPTMLVFTMPVDCYAAGTLHVSKRTVGGNIAGADVPICAADACAGQPDDTPGDDHDACTAGDRCAGGECRPGAPRVCPGSCLGCDPSAGCVPLAATVSCEDGNACTGGDHCSGDADVCVTGSIGGCAGQCLTGECGPGAICVPAGQGTRCSDGDPCTEDACDGAGGCASQPMTGIASVACLFQGEGLGTPDCADDRVPRGVTRRYQRAKTLIDGAASAPTAARQHRRLLRAGSTLTAAIRLTNAAEARVRLSRPCAAALRTLFTTARTRAEALAATP